MCCDQNSLVEMVSQMQGAVTCCRAAVKPSIDISQVIGLLLWGLPPLFRDSEGFVSGKWAQGVETKVVQLT